MRGCARFLVWLEPWLRRLVSEAARWARVGTRTVPNGQLRIDRARRGSNGHPSAAMLPDRECPRRRRESRVAAQNDAKSYRYRAASTTRATWDGALSPTHETRGASREVHVRRLSNEPRGRTHLHKPPTCAWRGGRRVQHTGMGRRHPVHRCSRHKLRTEITAERRRRQRSMAGLGRDDAAERETAGDGGRQIHGRSHARMQCEGARTVIGSRGKGGGVVSGMQPRAGGAPRDNFPRGLWGGRHAPLSHGLMRWRRPHWAMHM